MGKTIIVTAGPTNERIDAVMQITNMSTGALGTRIVEEFLGGQDGYSPLAESVDRIYYLSHKMARKPVVPDGQAYKLKLVTVASTQDLLDELSRLLTNPDEHVDAVIHSAAVGDYKGRYVARAEDLSDEIAKRVMNMAHGASWQSITKDAIGAAVLDVLAGPKCVQDDGTKISSYEPNLMVMLDLTPKVIGHVKKLSPNTQLIGFKLLEGVDEHELFKVAAALREKNDADYIVANDLAGIGGGKHPAMIVGYDHIAERNAIFARCETKAEIAREIADLVVGHQSVQPA